MNMLGALLISSWLWPFGGGNDEPTIESLADREVVIEEEQAIEASSELARQNYKLFLDLVGDDPALSAQAMRRLADLELEASEAAELGANMQSVMLSSYDGAVDLYQQLLKRYPDYERNDLVLYQLARAFESTGRIDEALGVLDQLVREYPTTVHYDEAQFRRGEMLFIQRDYATAASAYASLLEADEPTSYHLQSLYKLGWSQFKLAEHEASLTPFFALLDLRLAGDDVLGGLLFTDDTRRAERELIEDTLRVLSISFSYMDGANTLDEFFDSNGEREYAHVMYNHLGALYLHKERYIDAADSYYAFVGRQAQHVRAPIMELRAIEAYKQGGFAGEVLLAKERYVAHYGLESTYWQANDVTAAVDVIAALKANLTDLAQFYHARAQNPLAGNASLSAEQRALAQRGQVKEDYLAAARWYRKYLAYFPEQVDSAHTNFLLAEILFESESFAEATDEYERTAYDYPTHELSAEAGYAALLAFAEHEKTLLQAEQVQWHERSLNSSLRFAQTFPAHPQVASVLVATAEDYFAQARFEEAIRVAADVTTMPVPPTSELTRTAWTVTAHAYFDLAQFNDAELAYYQLQNWIPSEEQAAKTQITERIASSIYKQGESAREAGDLEMAVGHFLRVAGAAPNSPIREAAEYDAAGALITMGDWLRATSVLEAFRANYPDSEFSDQISRNLAAGYLQIEDPVRAAGELERIADDESMSAAEREEALWQAASLYKAQALGEQERVVLTQIVARYPSAFAETLEARARLAELASEQSDYIARARWQQEIIDVDAAAGAQRSDRSRYLAALATLELAEPLRETFTQMRLTIPLKQSLSNKRALMEQVLAEYAKAAQFGVAEVTTASTYRIAQVYQVFSRDLMDSERPADLDAEALDQYEILLEEQAFPFEEQAIEIYEANAARAADGVYDEWVQKSFTALATLLPARYAKVERSEDSLALLN